MRKEEVLGPRGELKDLAPPPGAMRAVCTLSPDAVRAVSRHVAVTLIRSIPALFVDQDPQLRTQPFYYYTEYCDPAPCSEQRLRRCYLLLFSPITICLSEFLPKRN